MFFCVVLFFCVVFVFYFIKISKFALPGVMLMYERTSINRKKERKVIPLDDRNGQHIQVYSMRGQREANLACLSSCL